MTASACRLIGFSLDDKRKIIADRNAKMAGLVLTNKVPINMVATRFQVSSTIVCKAVADAKKGIAP